MTVAPDRDMHGSRLAICAALASMACDHDRPAGHHDTPAVSVHRARVRRYFIAADEVLWDYAPSGRNEITGKPFDDVARIYVAPGKNRVGSRYQKALYREYTDATFTTLVPRDARWQHLGMLGPLIRATVGDTIEVHFRNHTSRAISMHPHGVFYTKANEGAPYADGTAPADKADDAVPPGGTYTYYWGVPESAGPTAHDGSTALWMYHSHTDEVRDVNAGLIGPIIITAAGKARPDGSPIDVDREFITSFFIDDENQSPYTKPVLGDPGYVESNLMHAINGYVYGNLPGLTMTKGERVRWYLLAFGSETDVHTPHWHANTVVISNMRTDVGMLMPGTMMIADMTPMAVGTWLFHCHVNDHLDAGMIALYTVHDD